MSSNVLERPVNAPLDTAKVVAEAIKLIQRHVDKEARHRKQRDMAIKDLCPTQKADLIRDLANVLR